MSIINNLKHGTIELLLLTLLNEQDMYGYQIMQELENRSGQLYTIKEGSLYPTLRRLLSKGLITDREERVGARRIRVYYHLTDQGRSHLTEIEQEYISITQGIENVLLSQKE